MQKQIKSGEENNYRYIEATSYRYLRVLDSGKTKGLGISHDEMSKIGKKRDVEIVALD